MPYILPEHRSTVDPAINELLKQLDRHNPNSGPGLLNYIFTRLLAARTPQNYQGYVTAVGVLETCKLELYRRHVGPYEDQKILDNGDVE